MRPAATIRSKVLRERRARRASELARIRWQDDPANIHVGQFSVKGRPLDIRHGDDRIVRNRDGGVQRFFGWFTPHQEAHRRAWAEAVQAEFERRGGSVLHRLTSAKPVL